MTEAKRLKLDDDPLRLDVGEGGDGLVCRPVMIFVAGWMSLLTSPFFLLPLQ